MIFLAVENPARLFGAKTGENQQGLIKTKKDIAILKKPLAHAKEGYQMDRVGYLQELDYDAGKGRTNWVEDMLADTEENRKLVLEFLNKNPRADLRISMGNSLGQILGTVATHSANSGDGTFHTLIFHGHGYEKGMNLGLGRFPLSTHNPDGESDARIVLGADNREANEEGKRVSRKVRQLDIDNTDLWKSAFQGTADYVVPRDHGDKRMIVLLMGCNTGNAELPSKAAHTINDAIGWPVCCACPMQEIDVQDLYGFVTSIDDLYGTLDTMNDNETKTFTFERVQMKAATSH